MSRVGGGVAREREARDEAEREQERRPQEDIAVGQPREEDERGDKREAERHRDERASEACRAIGLRSPYSRRPKGAAAHPRAEQEGGDPDVERRERADPGERVEAVRQPPARDEQRKPSPPTSSASETK
jgi:hypothetical protein